MSNQRTKNRTAARSFVTKGQPKPTDIAITRSRQASSDPRLSRNARTYLDPAGTAAASAAPVPALVPALVPAPASSGADADADAEARPAVAAATADSDMAEEDLGLAKVKVVRGVAAPEAEPKPDSWEACRSLSAAKYGCGCSAASVARGVLEKVNEVFADAGKDRGAPDALVAVVAAVDAGAAAGVPKRKSAPVARSESSSLSGAKVTAAAGCGEPNISVCGRRGRVQQMTAPC